MVLSRNNIVTTFYRRPIDSWDKQFGHLQAPIHPGNGSELGFLVCVTADDFLISLTKKSMYSGKKLRGYWEISKRKNLAIHDLIKAAIENTNFASKIYL
jgi:hypothetical protein